MNNSPEIIGFPVGTNSKYETPSLLDILGSDFSSRIKRKVEGRLLDGTIPEDIFIEEMILLWGDKGYGNAYSDKFIECWKGILSCFNRSLGGPGLSVSSATMGAGKTSTALLCLAIHTVLYPEEGAMMVCRRIKECDDAEKQLNELFGFNVSMALHSRTSNGSQQETDKKDFTKWRDKIQSTKILFTTHVNYLSSGTIHKEDKISSFNGKLRQLNIIDESIGFISRYNLTKSFIVSIQQRIMFLENSFYWDINFPAHLRKLAAVYKRISGLDPAKDGELIEKAFLDIENEFVYEDDSRSQCSKQIDNVISRYIKKVSFTALAREVSRLPEKEWNTSLIKKYYCQDDVSFVEFQQTLVQDILSIEASMKLKTWVSESRINRNKAEVSLTSGEIMGRISSIILQNDKLQSCVVLDATSHIDNTYKLLKQAYPEYVHLQPNVKDARNYRNVDFYIRSESSGTGKNTSITRASTRVPKIISWAKEQFHKGDKVLFCGTKKLMHKLNAELSNTRLSFETECMHWNCIDGRNDLKKYTTIIFLSIPNPPNNYFEGAAIALGMDETLTDTEKLTKYRANSICSYIATKLAQAIGRGALRSVVNNQGDCEKSSVYFLLNGSRVLSNNFSEVYSSLEENNKNSILLLQETFPNANWKAWSNFEGWKDSKRGVSTSSVSKKVERYLIDNLKSGESITIMETLSRINLTEKEQKTIRAAFRASSLEKSQIGEALSQNKITFVSNMGRGKGGTLFTKN